MWNTVLFDLDGTLTDSGEGITRCVQYALRKEFGIKVDDLHELESFVGPPLKEHFMEYASLSEEEADRAIRAYRERYRNRGIYENRVYDGIPEVLSQLAREGMVLGVASSKPTEFCREILRYFGLEQYFRVVIGSEMNGLRTKKADVLEKALKELGMSERRQEVVLIGDRMYDVEGAKQAGIASIGVTYGYGARKELEAVWPDCIVDSPEELRNVLIGQARDERGKAEGTAGRIPAYIYRESAGPAFAGGAPVYPGPGYEGSQQYYAFPPQGYGYSGRGQPGQGFEPPYPLPGYNFPPQGYYTPKVYRDIRTYDPQSVYAYPAYGNLGGNAAGRMGRRESVIHKLWRIVYPLLLDTGISVALTNLAMAFFLMISRDVYSANKLYERNQMVLIGIVDAVIILVFALLYRADQKKRYAYGEEENILRLGHFSFLEIIAVILFASCVSTVISLVMSYLPIHNSAAYDALEREIDSAGIVLQILVLCITGPVAEELLFRGLIYRRCRDYLGCAWAAVISGVIFGLAHGNIEQGVYAALFGVVLALIYEHYGTIWMCILAHAANNAIATFVNPVFARLSPLGQSLYMSGTMVIVIVFGIFVFSKKHRVNAV